MPYKVLQEELARSQINELFDKTDDAIIERDFRRFRSQFEMPVIAGYSLKPVMLKSVSELLEFFLENQRLYDLHSANAVYRRITDIFCFNSTSILVEAEAKLVTQGRFTGTPFRVSAKINRSNSRWKFTKLVT